ncbi:MAG: group I intron-associated PD-(D/E)XK endonuclease [Gammaproteobacteria bacterium]|nr:group I intron-associated PD-(D/E)XK endonuclease [Gammaproteobacteria bacterium]
MATFKDIAYKILKEAGEPLHYKEITKRALADGSLKTGGKTPEFTMHASLSADINCQKEKSRFKRKDRATFSINPKFKGTQRQNGISTKQKGDIAEARIAELITLYGEETSLSCYKPISDDDGIDFIVKEKGSLKSLLYIQVKSRFGNDPRKSCIADVKKTTIIKDNHMAMVFCYFNTEKGDLDSVWFVPAPDFLKKANKKKDGWLRFEGQRSDKKSNEWNSYLEEKHQLAERIISQMAKNEEEKNKR